MTCDEVRMQLSPPDDPSSLIPGTIGRRGAMRSLGAAGAALLVALGIRTPALDEGSEGSASQHGGSPPGRDKTQNQRKRKRERSHAGGNGDEVTGQRKKKHSGNSTQDTTQITVPS